MTSHPYTVHEDKQSDDTRRQLVSRVDGKFGIVAFHAPSNSTHVLWFGNEYKARRLYKSVTR